MGRIGKAIFGGAWLALLSEAAAFAQAQTQVPEQLPPPPGGFELLMSMFPMFVIVFFIFYFMVIRPQQQKLTAQQDLLKGLKRGDTVVTSSGIVGKIFTLEKEHVLLEVSNNVRIKIESLHIVKKQEKQLVEKSAA